MAIAEEDFEELESLANIIDFTVTLDGQEVNSADVVLPIQTAGSDQFGCGSEQGSFRAYFDVVLGRLEGGLHHIAVEIIQTVAFTDAEGNTSARRVLGTLEMEFEVTP